MWFMSSTLKTFYMEKQTSSFSCKCKIGSAPSRDNYCAILVSMSCRFHAVFNASIVSDRENKLMNEKLHFPSEFLLPFFCAQKESLWNGNPRRRRQEWEQIVKPNCCAFNSVFILIETITITLESLLRLFVL